MEDVLAPAGRLGPAFVGVKGGRRQLERAGRVADGLPQVGRAGGDEVADGAAHAVAVPEEVDDAVPGHETGGAGDQHPALAAVIHAPLIKPAATVVKPAYTSYEFGP